MLTFIMKDLLLFWRNRRETLTVVLLPVILVVILSFAFSGVMGMDSKPIELAVAIVNEDSEEGGIAQFAEQLKTAGEPAAAQFLIGSTAELKPITYLYDYLRNLEFSEWFKVSELSEVEAMEQLEDKQLDGYIKIPQGYTYDTLNAIVLNQDSAVPLPYVVKENSINSNVIESMINEFFDQINFQLVLQRAAGDTASTGAQAAPLPEGGRESVKGAERFTMAQYFTIAMGALFALFIASSVAEKTAAEKREHVTKRIILANTRSLSFLMGKTCSTFFLVWLQFSFVVIVSHFLLGIFSGKSFGFWLGVLLMITAYALTMAGLTALYTSITLKLRSMEAANGLFMLITMVLGLLGGNFVPIYLFPSWMQRFAEWTPNGLTLAVLTEWIQLEEISVLWMPLLVLSLFSIMCLLAGMALFPKRGEA